MKDLKTYDIDIQSLKYEDYAYEYRIDDKFFSLFEYSLIEKGEFVVKLILKKRETFIQLDFDIQGTTELTCDRSLKTFQHPISFKQTIVLKFGQDYDVLSEEMEVIPMDVQKVNTASYIYEFINVSLPMKRLHPDYEDEDEPMFFSTEDVQDDHDNENENDTIDPRWDILKKLKNTK
ncbi:MAG: DUF177 domain-containing protein [Cyclobacteriaceae bacterium]|nr:DUF177 domain-containing protein [Cyclobacteriaceae bacterium]